MNEAGCLGSSEERCLMQNPKLLGRNDRREDLKKGQELFSKAEGVSRGRERWELDSCWVLQAKGVASG